MQLANLPKNPKNPRKITPEKLEMLKKSVIEFGSLDGVVFNRQLERLVGGHQRQDLDPEAQVTIVKNYDPPTSTGTVAEGWVTIQGERFPYREVMWDDAKDKLANVAANKGAGQWDYPQLTEWMLELDSLNVDLDLTMFDATERENLLVPIERVPPEGDADHIPAAPKEPTTKTGDLWKLGDHFLLCGDSTLIDNVEKLMGEDRADLVWTDPPYNVDYEGKTKEKLKIGNDNMGDEDFRGFLRTVYTNMAIVCKPGAGIYVAHADSEGVNFRAALEEGGFLLKQCLIWVKQQFVMGRQDYHWQHEPILYGWKEGAAHSWHGDRKQTTVLKFDRPHRSQNHPTTKPIDLIEYCLRNSSQAGDIVLDLFGGSGSTLIACEKTTRKARLMELAPTYCDVIVRRWEEYTGQKAELVTQ